MNRRQFVGISGGLALVMTTGVSRSKVRAQTGYGAQDLGIPEGFDSVIPIALGSEGAAVVMASNAEKQAVFVIEDGRSTQVGKTGAIAHATCIDTLGNVGGWLEAASDGSSPARDIPVILTAGSQAEMPGKQLDGRVSGIQQAGTAVGEAAIDPDLAARKAVIWTEQDVHALAGIPDDRASAALDINAMGQIVGWIETENDGRMAVVLDRKAEPIELGTIGGHHSEAVAISEQGQIVGNSTTADDQTDLQSDGVTAVSWTDNVPTALQSLDGQRWSRAADVNSYGLVVGTVGLSAPSVDGAETTAVIWAVDEIFDLGDYAQAIEGIVLTAAVSTNDYGQVLCAGLDSTGNSRAILLSIIGN